MIYEEGKYMAELELEHLIYLCVLQNHLVHFIKINYRTKISKRKAQTSHLKPISSAFKLNQSCLKPSQLPRTAQRKKNIDLLATKKSKMKNQRTNTWKQRNTEKIYTK